MDRQSLKIIEEKNADNQASKLMSHRLAVQEQLATRIGEVGFIRCKLLYHRKPSLIRRILNLK